MKRKISKIQYISQGNSLQEQLTNIHAALASGIDWIQVRWKKADETALLHLAEKAKIACGKYDATLIINDHIQLAHMVDADGVHLGLEDDAIQHARSILGEDKIIGGTANSFSDVEQRIAEGCDYIGLGPFGYTTTKENLSPLLGLAGYNHIFSQLKIKGQSYPPIFAIGGIQLGDIHALLDTGLYGIAASTIINQYPEAVIYSIKEKTNGKS